MPNHRLNASRTYCTILAVVLLSGCTSTSRMTQPQASATTAPSAELMHPAFASIAASRPTTLPSGVFNFDELTVQATASGEKRQVLQQATATLDQLEVHITTLDPGQQSHPPHRHPHEEMMMLKEGTLEAFVNGKHIPMPTGSILFLAPFDLHNVKNVGTTRATYFVITWRTPRTGSVIKKSAEP